MTDVQVRRATGADLDAIVTFNHALFQEDAGQRDPTLNLNWSREGGKAHFTYHLTVSDSYTGVAVLDDRIIGYLVGYVSPPTTLRPVTTAELESMFVEEEVRSQGVGHDLIDAFVEWCREQGAERISVTAYTANDAAIRFYQRLGFEPKSLSLERVVPYDGQV